MTRSCDDPNRRCGAARRFARCLRAAVERRRTRRRLPRRHYDPIEPVNRGMFWFNDKMDVYVLSPVATGWDKVAPDPVQNSVSNFFDNLRFPIVFANDVLQAKPKAAAIDFTRFAFNTVVRARRLLRHRDGLGAAATQRRLRSDPGCMGRPAGTLSGLAGARPFEPSRHRRNLRRQPRFDRELLHQWVHPDRRACRRGREHALTAARRDPAGERSLVRLLYVRPQRVFPASRRPGGGSCRHHRRRPTTRSTSSYRRSRSSLCVDSSRPIAILALLLVSCTCVAAADDPRAVVEATTTAVVGVLTDQSLSADDKRRRIEDIVYARVDFETFTRLVLARDWSELNAHAAAGVHPGVQAASVAHLRAQRRELPQRARRDHRGSRGSARRLDRQDEGPAHAVAAPTSWSTIACARRTAPGA